MSVLRDDRCRHRVPRDLTLAFVALALDPTSRKPTRIFEAGPWWDVTRPVGPTIAQYRVITADDCGVCYRPASLHSRLSAVDDHEWEPQRFGEGVGPTPEQKAAMEASRIGMTHPTENAELMNHACEVLRRYAFDLNEAMENDDLIFEADYVLQILEHESLVDATTAGGVCVCGDTLGNHPIDASETL